MLLVCSGKNKFGRRLHSWMMPCDNNIDKKGMLLKRGMGNAVFYVN